MKPRLLSATRLTFPLASAIAALLAAQSTHATTYYWDDNAATAGFGTAGASTGTWAAPTAGGTAGWSLSATGANAFAGVTTATTDILNFGNGATGLAAGTITVSGTVNAGDMTFASGSGAILLSGGTINLAAAGTITVNNASDTISSALTGAGTSFTKAGTGTLILSGANTYTGTTIINGGMLTLNRQTGSLSTSSALTFTGTGTFNMDNAGASGALTQTLGALSFSAGDGTVKTTRTANFDQAITFASLTRSAGATGNFVNTGTNSATNGFVFTSAPTASQIIDPGYFYNGSSYAAYDSGGFVRGLIYGTDTNANASLTGAQTTLGTIGATKDTQYVATTATASTSNTASSASTTLVVGNGALFNVGAPLTGTGIAANTYVTAISGNNLTLSQSATVATNATITPYNLVSAQTTDSVNTLNLSGVGSSLRLAASQTLSVNGILRSAGSNSVASVISGGSGLTTVGSGGEMVVRTNTASDTLQIATPILANGANALTKSGSGTLTLSAANTYGGATVVAGGTLKLGGPSLFTENFNNGGLAQSSSHVQETTGLKLGNGQNLSGWTKAGDGTIHCVDRTGSNDWAVMFYGGHTAAGVNTITSAAITSANTLNQTYHVTFDLSAANYQITDQRNNGTTDGVTVIALDSLGNTIATQNFIPGSFESLASAGNLPFTTVTLNYVGTGTGTGVASFKFQATSPTSTGRFGGSIDNLFVTSAATNLLPTSTALSVASGSTFDLAGNNQTVASLADSGGGGGIVTSSAGSSTLTLNPSSGSTAFSGVISSQISLTKSGAGTQVLSGSNTYSGSTTLTGGTLNLGVAENVNVSGPLGKQLANAAGTIVLSGGTLQYSAANTNDYSGRFSTAASQAYNVDTNGQTVIWATALTSSGGTLNKSGTGTLTLSGSNTYSGTTTISNGKLAVNGSLASASSVTVQNGGTLQGSGSIGGSVTIQNGGTLATGNSIESLATGALSLQALATFAQEINNDAAATVAGDLTAVTGDLTLDLGNAAILTLTELGSGSWSANEKLTLISYSGTWNGGLFNYGGTLADDSTINFSGATWQFNYNDTVAGSNYTSDLTGTSFVTMTVIPEPRAALLGWLGMLMLLRRRR